MSAHSATIHPDEKYKAGKTGRKVFALRHASPASRCSSSPACSRAARLDHYGNPGGGWSRFLTAYMIGW